MPIIISKNGKATVRLESSSFENEDKLQAYIHDNPESIPLHEIKEGVRLLILAREFPTPSGPIDTIGFDADGDIFLIETKLYKNNDKRFVVTQVLDYGAALWQAGYDFSDFMSVMDEKVKKKFNMSAKEKLREYFELTDEETNALLGRVKANLNEGRFKFVVLMDKLHDRLKDLIVFLNANSKFDIYAVEVEYYKYETQEIVIPKLFGAEVKKDIKVSGGSRAMRSWDEASFFEHAKQSLSPEEFAVLERLLRYFAENFETHFGKGEKYGSFIVGCSYQGSPLSLFRIASTGMISFYTTGMKDRGVPSVEIHALGEGLASLHPDFMVSDPAAKYPQATVGVLTPPDVFKGFLKAMDSLKERWQK